MKFTTLYKGACMLLLAGISSCNDMLDVTPGDKLTPDTFFKSGNDLELYTNKFYPNGFPANSIIEDEADLRIKKDGIKAAVSCQRFVTETSGEWGWGPLRDINFYLEHSENCEDAAARAHYDGVARFFRALFYYNKVTQFGDVPWYTTALASDSPELYKPRDSRETVMQNIIADLDYAIANLPKDRRLYEVTNWTALALKSRAGLFEGTFRKYHKLDGWEPYLELCVSASDDLMRNGGYTIYSAGTQPYRELFSSMNAIADEMILARDFNASLQLTHSAHQFIYVPGMAINGATQRIFKVYLMKDGSYFSGKPGWEKMEFADETKDRDPRMAQTFVTPGCMRDGAGELPNLGIIKLGYQPLKYIGARKYDNTNAENDLPLYRYAEVLLNYAEAKAELGSLTQADIDRSIKLLRNRVNMPNLNMAQANSNPDPALTSAALGYPNVDKGANMGVILEIRRERTVELFMEGLRYNDLMRWKEGGAISQPFMGMYFPGAGEYDLDGDGTNDVYLYEGSGGVSGCATRLRIGSDITLSEGDKGFCLVHSAIPHQWNEERDYLYYIPSKERVLNPSLTQNPGWNDGLGY